MISISLLLLETLLWRILIVRARLSNVSANIYVWGFDSDQAGIVIQMFPYEQ